jgi:hypothetical protein
MKPVFAPHHVRRALEAELLAELESFVEIPHTVSGEPEFDRVPSPVSLRYRPFERLATWRLN